MSETVAGYLRYNAAADPGTCCAVDVRAFSGGRAVAAFDPDRRSAGHSPAGFAGYRRRLGDRCPAGRARIIIRYLNSRWQRAGFRSLPAPGSGSAAGAAAVAGAPGRREWTAPAGRNL